MKKLITILVLSSAMLSACEGDPEIVPRTPTEAKIRELMIGYDGKVDMNAFVTDAQRGVWVVDACDMTYTDGKVSDGSGYDGGTLMNQYDASSHWYMPYILYAYAYSRPDGIFGRRSMECQR